MHNETSNRGRRLALALAAAAVVVGTASPALAAERAQPDDPDIYSWDTGGSGTGGGGSSSYSLSGGVCGWGSNPSWIQQGMVPPTSRDYWCYGAPVGSNHQQWNRCESSVTIWDWLLGQPRQCYP